jgi:hypothetical protein
MAGLVAGAAVSAVWFLAPAASPALVVASEDDLAVVRRAVASGSGTPRDEDHSGAGAASKSRREAQWLRVRVTHKDGRGKVKFDLPLFVARTIGGEIPIEWGACSKGRKAGKGRAKLADVLDLLDAGDDVVRIETEDASIRIFVD